MSAIPPTPSTRGGEVALFPKRHAIEKLPLGCIAVPSCGKCENGLLASFRLVRNLFEISNSAAPKANSKFEKKLAWLCLFSQVLCSTRNFKFFEKTINVDIFCYFMINLVIP